MVEICNQVNCFGHACTGNGVDVVAVDVVGAESHISIYALSYGILKNTDVQTDIWRVHIHIYFEIIPVYKQLLTGFRNRYPCYKQTGVKQSAAMESQTCC